MCAEPVAQTLALRNLQRATSSSRYRFTWRTFCLHTLSWDGIPETHTHTPARHDMTTASALANRRRYIFSISCRSLLVVHEPSANRERPRPPRRAWRVKRAAARQHRRRRLCRLSCLQRTHKWHRSHWHRRYIIYINARVACLRACTCSKRIASDRRRCSPRFGRLPMMLPAPRAHCTTYARGLV